MPLTPAIPNDKLPHTVVDPPLPYPLREIIPIGAIYRLPDMTDPPLSTDNSQNIKKGEANVVPKINSVTVESATTKTTKTTSKKKKNRKQNKVEKKKVDLKIEEEEVIQEPSVDVLTSSANPKDSTVKRSKMTFRDKFNTCSYCESTIEDRIRICSGCRKVCYCDSKCQKSHWKMHKKQCIYALSKDQTTG